MSTAYADLIGEVRAQITVTEPVALRWLIDRARTMNSESQWLIGYSVQAGNGSDRYFAMPPDYVTVEAVVVSGIPYERSTAHKLDALYDGGDAGYWPQGGLYAEGQGGQGFKLPTNLQIYPVVSDGARIEIRYVADIPDVTVDPTIPFPDEFGQALVDGAIATGLARMDERFDSAGYFETRYADAISRLKRRRHGRAGRGFQAIRVFAP